jgi:phage/conjugal plasmid C-4 type zinc finger TraR family protein
MSDHIDRASEYAADMLNHRISAHVNRPVGMSAFRCEDCDQPIPEQRRQVIAGVTRCAPCQDVFELKSKHYRSV